MTDTIEGTTVIPFAPRPLPGPGAVPRSFSGFPRFAREFGRSERPALQPAGESERDDTVK